VRVQVSKVRLFRSPYLNFEVIEPRYPGQHTVWPNALDVGGWTMAFQVDDLDIALERMGSADVHVLGSPRRDDGNGARPRVSCLAEFGFQFDLVQGPSSVAGAWDPANPDR
jgi:hypothetical protein